MISKIFGLTILGISFAVTWIFEANPSAAGAYRIFHWPAMVLTGVGPIGLLLICSDFHSIRQGLSFVFGPSPEKLRAFQEREADDLHRLGQTYYAEGSRSFGEVTSPFFSEPILKALRRLAIKVPIGDVRDLLEREADKSEDQLHQASALFSLGARLAPSIGMLGTILGMVRLLSSMSDPSQIGSSMGLALLTTFYGLFFSLAVWTPAQHRLQSILDAKRNGFDRAIHWLELLEERKPVQYLSEELNSSLTQGKNPFNNHKTQEV